MSSDFALFINLVISAVILCMISSCTPIEKPNNSVNNFKNINHSQSKIIVDGSDSDEVWRKMPWLKMDQKWIGPAYTSEDFTGKFKLAWHQDQLFVLAEIVDDKLMDTHPDGLVKYWDDDCLEIFVDEDASGGDHQYNYNAFAYHIALDNKVADIGIDSLAHYYDHINCVRNTVGNTTTWELSIDLYDDTFELGGRNQKVKLYDRKEIGFAIAYCDNDTSSERENFIGSTYVKGEDKNRGWIDAGIFDKFTLTK